MKTELVSFTSRGGELAEHLARRLCACGHEAACTRDGLSAADWAQRGFARSEALIFVGAAGIAVRSIAPYLKSKAADPAVLVIDEAGQFVVPILSGHLGGANDLAREISAILGAQCVLTTATDVNGLVAFDQWARDMNCAVPYPERILPVSRKMLEGQTVGFWSEFPVEGEVPEGVALVPREKADVQVLLKKPEEGEHKPLIITPRALSLGVGCRKNTPAEHLEQTFGEVLEESGYFPESVCCAASVTLKAEEPGLLEFCKNHRYPLHIYTPQELSSVEGSFTASEFVKKVTGVDNICERSAVLSSGGRLVYPKLRKNGVTMALALGSITLKWRK